MTPEESFYIDAWKIIGEIKEKYLATPKKQPPRPNTTYGYTPKPHGVEIWLQPGSNFNQRKNIIYKLEEWKLFTVLDETRSMLNYEGTRFILKILQPRFDKVYQSWEEINENPWLPQGSKISQIKKLLEGKRTKSDKTEEKFDRERERVAAITIATDHRLIRDKWLAVKRILDIISKQLSPLEDEERIIEQTINIDVDGLSPIQKKFLPFVLKHSFDAGVTSFVPGESNVVITAEPAEKFLSGQNIVIENRYAFEDYRQKISELYHFIEEDGMARFPEAYQSSILAKQEKLKRINKEVVTQLGELTEKQEEKESWKKEIIEEIEKKQIREPIPIKIVDEVKIKGSFQEDKKDKNKFPYKLPAGTKWENFIMQFSDEENISIKVRQYKHNANYIEMGLVDKRWAIPRPNEGWIFLRVLAKVNGELSIKDPEAKDKYKKQKELVIKALQSYFQIDYDPFYPYEPYLPHKTERSYKIKITLLPSPQVEKQTFPLDKEGAEKELDDEIKEFFNEQAPQVWDRYQ